MNKLLLTAIFLVSVTLVSAQQINLQAGKSFSKFKFRNSQGDELQNLRSTDHFFMVVGYRQNILKKHFKDKLFGNIGVGLNGYGTTGSDRLFDNYFAWELTYIGLNLGLDYEFYRTGRFIFFASLNASPEFLVRGLQTLNNQVYDLVGEDDFDAPIYFFRGGVGAQFLLSRQTSIYLQYMGGASFNFNKDPEKLNIIAHNFGFGLLIDIFGRPQSIASHGGGIAPNNNHQIEALKKEIKAYSKKIDNLALEAQRVEGLEKDIAMKDAEMSALKDTIASALFYFNGKGLNVNEREGKIYVTMDNDMLFKSGSWIVQLEGVGAVQALGSALAQNPEVAISIEGHTDNQPYAGSANIKDNWDLSIKRATAIVEILQRNPKINPRNLTAAGRGEHAPIASNDTSVGRAKNRRIEVIISPQLSKVSKIVRD